MTSLEARRKQLAERFLRAASPDSSSRAAAAGSGRRPSAAEWLSGSASPRTEVDGVLLGSSAAKTMAKPSAAAWCDALGGTSAAASAVKAPLTPAAAADEERDRVDSPGAGSAGGSGRSGSRKSRGGVTPRMGKLSDIGSHFGIEDGEDEGCALADCSMTDDFHDEESEWPKLDVNRQHFSSKEEPIILGDDPPAAVPAHVARFLREYQREGVKWLYDKYRAGTGAILGDDMGLGKTVQTAGLLIGVLNKSCTAADVKKSTRTRRLAEVSASSASTARTPRSSFTARASHGSACKSAPAGIGSSDTGGDAPAQATEKGLEEGQGKEEAKHDTVEEAKSGQPQDQEARGPVLIVCPASLVRQWKVELLTWAHFEVECADGAKKDEVLKAVASGQIEVIVCSYSTYLKNSKQLNTVDWEVVIFDECHTIKNPLSSTAAAASDLRCRRRIGLTGTLLQNNMMELYTTLDWAVPRCLGCVTGFRV
jgi:hypothetical protein